MLLKRSRFFSKVRFVFFSLFILVLSLHLFCVNSFAAQPSAVNDEAIVDEDSEVVIAVLDNDSNIAANRTITIISQPNNGEVSVIKVSGEDTKVKYEPNPDFSGKDSFDYRVTNDGGGSSEARVTIEVSPINDPPIPERELYVTQENTPVKIVLSATDKDIDPMKPDRHPIKFEVLSGPIHGELKGDVGNVQYESPNTAFVELEYFPDEGFKGIETITYLVEDSLGTTNISSIEIDVIAETEAPTSLSGYLKGAVTLEDEVANAFSDYDSSLTSIYTYSDLEVRANTSWSMDDWDTLRIRSELPLGGANIRSTIDFDPTETESFSYWRTRADFEFSDIDFQYTFNLDQDSEDIYNRLDARWSLESVSFRNRSVFTGANPMFDENVFQTRWRWEECELTVNTNLSFTDEGFEKFSVDVGNVPLFYGTYLEFDTTFEPDSKEVEPNLFYRSEWVDCFKLLAELETDEYDNKIEGFSIYGLRFRHEFPNGIELRVDSSTIEEKNSSVTGNGNFSNRFRLSGPFYAGYSSPGRWQLTNYLGAVTDGSLFSWGESKLKVIAPVSEDFQLNTEVTYRQATPKWELEIGGEVYW